MNSLGRDAALPYRSFGMKGHARRRNKLALSRIIFFFYQITVDMMVTIRMR